MNLTPAIDSLFLELSLVTSATTQKELLLMAEIRELKKSSSCWNADTITAFEGLRVENYGLREELKFWQEKCKIWEKKLTETEVELTSLEEKFREITKP